MNGYQVTRKSHGATQEKCPHVVHFNVPRNRFETNSQHQKRYSEDGKKFRGCRGLLGRVLATDEISSLCIDNSLRQMAFLGPAFELF